MKTRRFLSAAGAAVLTAALAGAAETVVRPVAADRPGRPACSAVADFRLSPFGGLIMTDWAGGLSADAVPLFETRDRKAIGPGLSLQFGRANEPAESGILGEIEALAEEQRKRDPEPVPPREQVDPLYQGKTYPKLNALFEIGPRYAREAKPLVIPDKALLQPGGIALGAGGGPGAEHVKRVKERVEVDFYPVRFTAVRSDAPGRRVPFRPALEWGGRDLLADLKAEYSQALPSGAPASMLDDKGRPRVFFDLTLYLPPTIHAAGKSGTPYRVNGVPFHLGPKGIELAEAGGRAALKGPFDLQLALPAEPGPAAGGAAAGDWVTIDKGVLKIREANLTQPRAPIRELRLTPFPPVDDAAPPVVRPVKAGTVDVSDLPAGLYRVEADAPGCPVQYAVVAKPGARGSVSFFTRNNRCDYRQGETLEVTAVLRAVEAVDKTELELVARDEKGRSFPLGTVSFSAARGKTDSRQFALHAGQFQPGRYVLSAGKGAEPFVAHRMVFYVHPRELKTTWEGFSTTICETGPFRTPEGLISYRTLLQGPVPSLRNEAEIARYTGQPALPSAAVPLCRRDALFPVEEAAAEYEGEEKNLAAAERFGVQHLPHAAWGMDGQTANWNTKHSYGESLDWMRRMLAQRAQIFREFDSFGGFFLNWYPSLGSHYEMHPPAAGFVDFQNAALQKAVQEAQGPLPAGWAWSKENGLHYKQPDGTVVKSADVIGTGVPHPNFNSEPMRDLVEWTLRGQRRRTRAYSLAYEAWTDVPRRLGDWNYLSFLPVGWFRGPDIYPPLYFESLPRTGLEAYTDWQVDPFMELFGIDYYGAGSGKPPWVQAMSGGRPMQIRQTFLGAARGAWGLGCDAGSAVVEGKGGEDLRALGGLMERYGPWFMTMTPASEVAIVRSFRQEAADGGGFRGSGGRNGMIWFDGLQGELWMLYYNLLRSGYAADFITEEEIEAGALKKYKAVFLHRQRLQMPPAHMKQFEDYVKAGGRVIKDPTTAPVFPGEVVNLGADESIQPNVGSSSHVIGQRYLWLLYNYLRCQPRLTALLATFPKPWVRSDHYHIVQAALGGKEVRALFAINDTMVPPEVHTREPWFIQCHVLTRLGSLFFDKPYYLYDITEDGREIRPGRTSSGEFAHPADFLRSEGRILVVTERPLREVRARAEWRTGPAGDTLRVEPVVSDDAGKPFNEPLPFEVTVQDPDGRTVKQVCRAAGPGSPVELTMGWTGASGNWTIKARLLVTGKQASVPLAVKAGPGPALAAESEGKVRVRRPDEAARFLKEKKALTIVLDEGQSDTLAAGAEELAGLLRKNGKACEVLRLDPLQVYDLPLRWRRNGYDSNVWDQVVKGERVAVRRGLRTLSDQELAYYDHPDSGYEQPGAQFALFRDVILIGTPRDNRLVADLHGVVNRPATAHCPGPGGALIQVTWDAFAPRFDALSLQVEDGDGLARARQAVERLLANAPPAASATVRASGESSGPNESTELVNVQRDAWGVPVGGIRPLADGTILVSLSGAELSGPVHFVLDGNGQITKTFDMMLGGLEPVGQGRYLQNWRGSSVLLDAGLKPIWQMIAMDGGSMVRAPASLDFYMTMGSVVLRVNADGTTAWSREFMSEMRSEGDFLKPWRPAVQAVSPDGKRLLVSGYREQMYGHIVSGYEDPALLMLDAATGETIWRKDGLMIRNTACLFAGDRIVVGAAPPAPRLVVLDRSGNVLRDTAVKNAVTSATLLSDNLALIREEGGLGVGLFDLAEGRALPIPVRETISGAWSVKGQLVIGTWARGLHVFDYGLKPVKALALPSTAVTVAGAPDGKGLLVGTASGQVLWLDGEGKVERTVDFNSLNRFPSEKAWADRWLGKGLEDAPVRRVIPWAGQPVSTLDGARPRQTVSANLLKNGGFEEGAAGWTAEGAQPVASGLQGKALRVKGPVSQAAPAKPGETLVLSLFQRKPESGADGVLAVKAVFTGSRETFETTLPLSAGWEERTVSFRPPPGASGVLLTLTPVRKVKTGTEPVEAELDRVELCRVDFRSRNLLAQKVEKVPSLDIDELTLDNKGGGLGDMGGKAPDIRQTIPWIAHVAAASGASAEAPRIVTPWFNLVDGKLTGQESSWTGKSVPQGAFSDHARMTVEFSSPRPLNAVAVYEDPADPERYTTRFALFAKTKQGVRLLGFRDANASPYNLFTFETVEADSLIYIWDGSPDGHIRMMEIEAYAGEGNALDL